MKFGSENRCLNMMVICRYIAPGQGQIHPMGQFFPQKHKSFVNLIFAASFSHLITLTDIVINT